MSPTAAGMAATLHLLAALALLWGTPLKNFEVPEQAIEVTVEKPPAPKAEPPPPPAPTPPAVQAQPAPPPPEPTARRGAPPVEAKPPPTEKPKPTEQTSVPLGVKPPSERTTEPPQQASAQPPPPQKEAPPAEPTPTPETKLPPVETPPAPLSMQDFVRAAPPPLPQEIVRPQPRVQPPPPPATPTVQQPPPQQQFAPSPLGHPPQQQRAPADSQASAALVNPADATARSRAADEYVWAVIRKFSQYLPDLREKNEGGTVVVRMVIARDGRLLESSIAKSSGVLPLDKGMLEALRAAAPYPPLPAEIPGDHIVFTQPITAKR
jgi:TonB family protein